MTAFVWIDRDGRRHELDSPARIEAEAADVAREMDRHVDTLDDGDIPLRDRARAAIRKLQLRLEQLRADMANWNDHAIVLARVEAATLAAQIERLPAMIAGILLITQLHREHAQLVATVGDAAGMLEQMLADPMTEVQRRAIAACRSRTAPPATATRGEAKAWLDDQPQLTRGGLVDGGWFAWIDRNGHAHRLTDPLMIEHEVVAIARELVRLRGALTDNAEPDALYAAIDAGSASWGRLQILQGELERFELEATTREDAAWTAYAADWRSKRKTS